MCPGGTDSAETGSELVGYLGEDWKFLRGDSIFPWNKFRPIFRSRFESFWDVNSVFSNFGSSNGLD